MLNYQRVNHNMKSNLPMVKSHGFFPMHPLFFLCQRCPARAGRPPQWLPGDPRGVTGGHPKGSRAAVGRSLGRDQWRKPWILPWNMGGVPVNFPFNQLKWNIGWISSITDNQTLGGYHVVENLRTSMRSSLAPIYIVFHREYGDP